MVSIINYKICIIFFAEINKEWGKLKWQYLVLAN